MNEIAQVFIDMIIWDIVDPKLRQVVLVLLHNNYIKLERHGAISWGGLSNIVSGLLPEEIIAGQTEGKLVAVKLVKNRMNDGLMNAKILVEKCFEDNNLKFHQPKY